MVRKDLFLPIEVMRREFTAKLLIGVEAASSGFNVVLGHKSPVTQLALAHETPGVYFHKSVVPTEDKFGAILRTNGYALVAQDEEAGIIYDDFADFFQARRSLAKSAVMDRFFCWGTDEFEFLNRQFCQEALGSKLPFRNTGSPRSSLWGKYGRIFHSEKIAELRARFGPFVLFPTNFASGNSYLSQAQLTAHLSQYPGWDAGDAKKHESLVANELRFMELFTQAAIAIAGTGDFKVVVRPHPAESEATWRMRLQHVPGAYVEADGDVTPWILAAEFLVHNSCSTGLEAAVSGVPTFALGECSADLFQGVRTVPNRVSIAACGLAQLLAQIPTRKRIWAGQLSECDEWVSRKLTGAGSLSSIRAIVHELEGLCGSEGTTSWKRDLYAAGRKWIGQYWNGLKRKDRSTESIMEQQKRQPLTRSTLSQCIKRAQATLGRDEPLSLTWLAPNVYLIRRIRIT